MKLQSRPVISVVVKTTAICLLCVVSAAGQNATQEAPLSDKVFKNVQVLKGIPVDEFMGTMGFFAASLSLTCTECHVEEAGNNTDQYAVDTPMKQTTRKMILMVRSLNQSFFGGKRDVTCYTCHHTGAVPKTAPSLLEQYGIPEDDPNEVELLPSPAPGTPTPDQILDKYIRALGGAQRLAGLTSYVAKGTYEGFDTNDEKSPLEIYAKAPAQSAMIVHVKGGNNVRTFDGQSGWNAMANGLVPLLAVTGGDLDGAKFDASLFFPGGIKQDLSDLHSGFPTTTIDDRQVEVVQGTTAGKTSIKLYFDEESGLLVRQVRYRETSVGPIPTQIDYSDYKEVSGIKMPFHWVTTWTDGRSTTELSQVQLNVPIDVTKFGKPKVPAASP